MKKNKKPSIALLLPSYGMVSRGTEHFAHGFVHFLQKDFEVTIFSRYKTAQYTKSFFCISSKNSVLNYIYTLNPWVQKKLDIFCLSPDHIEALTFSIGCLPHLLMKRYDLLFPQTGFWGALLCRIIRYFIHTPFIYRSAGGIEPLVARQNPNIYFCINPSIQLWFQKYFPQMRSIFICNGVDTTHFNPKGEKARIGLEKPIIITVAALIPPKAIELTIDAVAQIKGASLLIVGSGTERSHITDYAQKKLGNDRFMIVSADYMDIPRYYRAADVFAFSAPNELGWGMVHLEAAASNLPIVANIGTGFNFLVADKALLCDVTDSREYARCIERAFKNHRKYSARQKILQYSWPKVAQRYRSYIYELIESKNNK